MRIPDGVPDQVAVLTEPLATPVSALRAANAAPGSRVLVLGGGPIGLLTVYACAVMGVESQLIEPLAHRRRLALDLGATAAHASADELQPASFDLAVDAVGIEATWQAAIAAVRMGGSVTIVGLGAAQGTMAVGDLVRRGITVRGHYAYTRQDFEAALGMLAAQPPQLSWVESLPLSDGARGFRLLAEEPDAHVKVLLVP